MRLRIFKYGEPVLRKQAAPVLVVTDDLRALASDMIDAMHRAKGVGLAAQQIGHTESICVIDIPEGSESEEDAAFNASIPMPLVLFNPQIVAEEGVQHDKEGCLSFPGIGGSVSRAAQVTCQYLDEANQPQMITARGFLARALQHEIDHLGGILYIDRLDSGERETFESRLEKLATANGGTR